MTEGGGRGKKDLIGIDVIINIAGIIVFRKVIGALLLASAHIMLHLQVL